MTLRRWSWVLLLLSAGLLSSGAVRYPFEVGGADRPPSLVGEATHGPESSSTVPAEIPSAQALTPVRNIVPGTFRESRTPETRIHRARRSMSGHETAPLLSMRTGSHAAYASVVRFLSPAVFLSFRC